LRRHIASVRPWGTPRSSRLFNGTPLRFVHSVVPICLVSSRMPTTQLGPWGGGGGYSLIYWHPSTAVMRLWRGDLPAAEREIELGNADEGSPVFDGFSTGLRPLLLVYDGRRTEASELLEDYRGVLEAFRPGGLWQSGATLLCSAIEAWSLLTLTVTPGAYTNMRRCWPNERTSSSTSLI